MALKRRKQDVAKKNKAEKGKLANSEGAEPKAATTPKASRKKPGSKKTPVRAKKPASPGPSTAYEPSDEEIRIRAYFIAERRMRLSLSGDSAHDWIEARRQLIEEGKPATS